MQNVADNIPTGTDLECQEPAPDLGQMVDDIIVNGFCEKSGLTLDNVLEQAETDVFQYVAILKLLITYQSRNATDLAKKYVSQLAYKMLEEIYAK